MGQIREEVVRSRAADVDDIVERLGKVARRRVRQKMRSPLLSNSGGEGDGVKRKLHETAERVKAKEDAIQKMLDHSVALAYLSEGYMDSIENFRGQTAPVLQEELGEEARRVRGWVDKLRVSAAHRDVRKEGEEEEEGFSREAMKALRLEGTMSAIAMVKHVEKLLQRNHDRQTFLECLHSAVPRTRSPTMEETSLIENYRAQEKQWNERAEKLLRRKSDKADAGMGIVRDVDDVVQETRSLTGG
ncbi:hypothetical protein BDQ17DRAFT_1379328 [Cyathus striatus]|nr:hypothetical protein BDQ17DRAFT_1379328 [Cyathus striatus]